VTWWNVPWTGGDQYRGIVAVDRSWRTPDRQWLVDEVVDEPGVGYRIWHEGEFADAIGRDPDGLRAWLAAHDIAVDELELAVDDDPFCE
jgi:hypothetical protein